MQYFLTNQNQVIGTNVAESLSILEGIHEDILNVSNDYSSNFIVA